MEIEDVGNHEARVRHSVEEVEKIAGALSAAGELELAEYFSELHADMSDGNLRLMKPARRRRVMLSEFIPAEERSSSIENGLTISLEAEESLS